MIAGNCRTVKPGNITIELWRLRSFMGLLFVYINIVIDFLICDRMRIKGELENFNLYHMR